LQLRGSRFTTADLGDAVRLALKGLIQKSAARRFPPPWSVEELNACSRRSSRMTFMVRRWNLRRVRPDACLRADVA
jgi:hypothetical protein